MDNSELDQYFPEQNYAQHVQQWLVHSNIHAYYKLPKRKDAGFSKERADPLTQIVHLPSFLLILQVQE